MADRRSLDEEARGVMLGFFQLNSPIEGPGLGYGQ
jgi:hypothetical protein